MAFFIILLLTAGLVFSHSVAAQIAQSGWRCLNWDGVECSADQLGDPSYRQIVVLSTAYPEHAEQAFWSDFEGLINDLSVGSGPDVWSAQRRDQILYVGFWVPGGDAGSPDAAFGAHVIEDPGGEPTLATDTVAILVFIGRQQALLSWLQPLGVAVLFQGDIPAAPNATPPSFLGGSYGIARFTAAQSRGTYIATHELGHAALNFLDEYVESGLADQDISALQILVPRLVMDESLPDPSAAYDYNIAEILAGNGPVNLAPRSNVTTVKSPGSGRPQKFEQEGGLFFGLGTWHDAGANLMNGNTLLPEPGDGFAPAHSESQQQFIDALFDNEPARANDRIRAAGPISGAFRVGDTVDLLLYDADKNNSFHRTLRYSVQVGWWERSGAKSGGAWRVDTYEINPEPAMAYLPFTGDLQEEQWLLLVTCRSGMAELSSLFNGYDICDRQGNAFLPTFVFYTPYAKATVPASQWFTNYWWRFSSYNGHEWSGWTGWSSFYRSF